MNPKEISIFGISIVNVTKAEVLVEISAIIEAAQTEMMFFVNAHTLTQAYYNARFRDILKQAKYIYGDGIGVSLAGKVINQKLLDNVNGTDLFPLLCELCEQKKYSMYFLGSKPGITQKMVVNLKNQYPGLLIAGEHHGYFDFTDDSDDIIKQINTSHANILLVGFGSPLQEEWIVQNIQFIHSNIIVGVGGLFDFYSGEKRRAPLWMRKYGVEWFFRLNQEPGRLWRRYLLGIPKFIFYVFLQKVRQK